MLAKLAYHNVISLFSHQLNKEGIAKLPLIAFERFHRSLTFDENPLLLGVIGFTPKVKSR